MLHEKIDKTDLYNSDGEYIYSITPIPLSREFFTTEPKTLYIRPKGDNMIQKRSTFIRLKEVNFIL
jgi:hypothetical protein